MKITQILANKAQLFEDIGYKPHEYQLKVHLSNARFRVLMSGRRFGKSLCAANEAIAAMVIPLQRGWIVAPTYDLAKKVFREVYWKFLKNKMLKTMVKTISEHNMFIELINGSTLEGKSADNVVSLVGEGLNFLIIDEAARIKEEVWQEALRPTLTDKIGWALFISTPKGMNWFYGLFQKGQEKINDYESWTFRTEDNPFIDKNEIIEAEATIPMLIFKQEYLAEPVAMEDMYFPWDLVDSCISDKIPIIENLDDLPKSEFYCGIDPARLGEDSSVIVISEKQWTSDIIRIVRIFELKKTKSTDLAFFIEDLDRRFNFKRIYIEENGLGGPIVDNLQMSVGMKVEGIVTKLTSKMDLYQNLKILMEKGKVVYPNIQKLIYQMKDLRYKYVKNGMEIHHSPNGHDDFTDAAVFSLAWYKFKSRYTPTIA